MVTIFRTLPSVVLLLLSLVSVSVSAMSLSSDELKSKLNQKLNFIVELNTRDLAEFNSLTVNVISEPREGESRYSLNYQLIQSEAGNFLHITSQDVIREPILHFKLALNWQQGHLIRDYALLLDLPEN